jgi:hypothetical protein
MTASQRKRIYKNLQAHYNTAIRAPRATGEGDEKRQRCARCLFSGRNLKERVIA